MFDAIILAGGSARRMDGADKPGLAVGGRTLLERVLDGVADAVRAIVVGPTRALSRPVTWCREQPIGGGPVAAIAAGLDEVRAERVVVLAADLPYVAAAVPELLFAVRPASDPGFVGDRPHCAVLIDAAGRRNHLAAAWHTAALRDAVAALPRVSGAAARSLYGDLRVRDVPDRDGWSRDCDTLADVAAAERALR